MNIKPLQSLKTILLLTLFLWSTDNKASAQDIMVSLATLDGTELTPSNLYNYDIINNSGKNQDIQIKGSIRFRNSDLSAIYQYKTTVNPGKNSMDAERASGVNWVFSNNALRELLFDFGKLPQGTYEYCVSVNIISNRTETPASEPVDECIYQTVHDIFLINLVAPENNAKLSEYNPMLSWVVNFPFASMLTYRLRVAEQKQGQNNESAINRNNPIYEDRQVTATGQIYPTTATPLITYQPYVWTVDAYYKGILLGGAEAWRFIIVEDSLLKEYNAVQSYFDFVPHYGEVRIPAIGSIKLKYVSDKSNDSLFVRIEDESHSPIKLAKSIIPMQNGNNHFEIPIYGIVPLVNGKSYSLYLTNKDGKSYSIPFKYLNPLFIDEPGK